MFTTLPFSKERQYERESYSTLKGLIREGLFEEVSLDLGFEC